MGLKRIQTKLCIRKYIITFAYETKKGYYRESQTMLKELSEIEAKSSFYNWANAVRTMFKVKILSIVEQESYRKYIEL